MPDATSFNDALCLHQQGRLDEAERAYRQILAEKPEHPGALHLLGVIRQQRDDPDAALDLIGRAISLNPHKAVYRNNYGAALLTLGRYGEALRSFQRSLAIRPNYPDALANLALVQTAIGRESDAMANYRKALSLDPRHRDARRRLARLLEGSGRHQEVCEMFPQGPAERRSPEDLLDLGNIFLGAGREAEAADQFRELIAVQPENAKAQFLLATACELLYRIEDARRHFEGAARLEPGNRLWQLRSAMCAPAVFESGEEIEGYCARLERVLEGWSGSPSPPAPHPERARGDEDGVDRTPPAPREENPHAERDEYGLPAISLNDLLEAGVFPGFAFSYHGRNQRALKEQFARLYEPCFRDQPPPAGSSLRDRKRIGILVTRRHESIFLRCMKGILQRLSPKRFESVVLCSRGSLSGLRKSLSSDALRFMTFDDALGRAAAQIREAACDLMYYWEVGSDAMNYFLPFARLAPVQCTSHGSLITTGIRAVDYFYSSDLIETDAADDHYSEGLWRSRTLLMYQDRLPPTAAATPADFGLPDSRHLYVCFQNPSKLHPDFDRLLAGVLEADPRGLVVLLADRSGQLARLLKERFARRIPRVQTPSPPAPLPEGEGRIVFLPPQPFADYCRLIQLADVILDPPHYGAGSSCYDLFSYNLPVVTLPGELIVGRVTQACYRKMGVDDLVVHSAGEYVRKAVQVATDRDYRQYVTERIARASDVLFNDVEAVREHERFFDEALSHVR